MSRDGRELLENLIILADSPMVRTKPPELHTTALRDHKHRAALHCRQHSEKLIFRAFLSQKYNVWATLNCSSGCTKTDYIDRGFDDLESRLKSEFNYPLMTL